MKSYGKEIQGWEYKMELAMSLQAHATVTTHLLWVGHTLSFPVAEAERGTWPDPQFTTFLRFK